MFKNFSNGYKKILIDAENKTKNMRLRQLCQEDVLLEIVENGTGAIKEIFNLYGIDKKLILEISQKGIFNETFEKRAGVYSGMSKTLKEIILGSVKIAASFSKEKTSLEDFLLSLLQNNTWFAEVLNYVGANPRDIEENINELQKVGIIDGLNPNIPGGQHTVTNEEIDQLLGAIGGTIMGDMENDSTPFDHNTKQQKNKKDNDSNTPALDFFSTNLTKLVEEGKNEKVIGRENEIERLISILNRKTKNNPALVGEPGVGKTAIVEGLAARIVAGDVPFSMKDKKVLSLDLSAMVAGTKYRGEFEARLKQVIEEASKVENEVILFIDEIHTIIGAGSGEGGLDASNILKPAMGRGQIRIIGATTNNEYKKYIEKDSALERRFQKIATAEPSQEIALEIISGLKEVFEEYHNLNITHEAVEEAIHLSTRYITDRFLPDKAIDLIDEACSLKSMKYNVDETEVKKYKEQLANIQKKIESAVMGQHYDKAKKLKEKQGEIQEKIQDIKRKFSIPKEQRFDVKVEDIQHVLSIATGIPASNLSKNEVERLKKLPKVIKSKIIGQDDAVDSIIKSIMRSKAGISSPNRPLGSFLFLGPTGVGKTQLVKELAREFYGDDEALIKIDMSEYSDKTSANKLIGANAGYVGYEEGGLLTEKVRKKPYSIVLFDEIEKGDFEIYNLLLQILEEGILTDNKGRKINFKNTIIVMTSNIGQDEFGEKAAQIGFNIGVKEEQKVLDDYEVAREKVIGNLKEYFSPEFLNRIDKIEVFNPLDKKSIRKIVLLQLEDLESRLKKKAISLKYDTKVVNYITKNVYNPEYGAREIRRFLTDTIEDKIANLIILGKVKSTVELSIAKNELIVN